MLRAVRRWQERTWGVEGCQGIGRHIATRLIADGEHVVDVPPKLSARTRVSATGQGRKTDAHSVAFAATSMTGLRPVIDDEQLTVATRSKTVCVALLAQPCTSRRADRKQFAGVTAD
jgi:NAD(P)-dependent dehydrogenase (short-subunit alcohol dehydrogenase family)